MSAVALPVRERLLAVLDLAERPGTPGEAEAACYALGRLVLANSSAFRAILTAPALPRAPVAPGWRDLCETCLRCPLRTWEMDFLRSLRGFPRISQKQRDVLHAIAERLGVLEGAR